MAKSVRQRVVRPSSFNEYLTSVINQAPVRKVRANFKSVTGTFCSIDCGDIDFESKNELEGLLLLESTPNVQYLIGQPDYIGHYPPDYLVVSNTRRIFTEMKYVDELIKKWDELSPNYYRAQDFAQSLGAEFGLITDDIIKAMKNRVTILKGVRLLGRPAKRDPGILEGLTAIISERASVTVKELASAFPSYELSRITSQICKMMVSREAYLMDTPTPYFEDAAIISADNIDPSTDYLNYIITLQQFCSDYIERGDAGS